MNTRREIPYITRPCIILDVFYNDALLLPVFVRITDLWLFAGHPFRRKTPPDSTRNRNNQETRTFTSVPLSFFLKGCMDFDYAGEEPGTGILSSRPFCTHRNPRISTQNLGKKLAANAKFRFSNTTKKWMLNAAKIFRLFLFATPPGHTKHLQNKTLRYHYSASFAAE